MQRDACLDLKEGIFNAGETEVGNRCNPLAFRERSRAAKPHVRGDGNAIRNLRTANDQTAAFRGFGLLHNWTLRRMRTPAVTLIPLSPRH